ncbi:MAG: hypothetical protein HY854_03360 [Burkholderiales bacterium]|nr:hypothetical protein [Burkholderiales bacterium]
MPGDMVVLRSILLLLFALVHAEALPQGYLGCFRDGTQRVLTGESSSNPVMTSAYCIAHCKQQGAAFAGLQSGSQCTCGDRLESHAPADNCDVPCTGNKGELCGGGQAVAVYSTSGPPAAAPLNGRTTWVVLAGESPVSRGTYDNQSVLGPLIAQFALGQPRAELCANACGNERRCVAYMYVKPGAYRASDPPFCQLKSRADRSFFNWRATSGVLR